MRALIYFKKWIVPLAALTGLILTLAPFAWAQGTNTVNQGAPGKYGAWPVDIGSGTITNPLQVRLRDATGTTLTTVVVDGAARGTPAGPTCMWDDGTNMQSPLADTGGRPQVNTVGADDSTVMTVLAAGTAVGTPNGPVCMWSDATNLRSPLSDSGGRPQVNLVGSDDATVAAVDAQNNLNTVSFANTTVTQTEVLVLNSASTATPTTPASGRRSIEIQNRGPNSIFCKPGGTGALNTTREIRPGDAWSLDLGSAIAVGCRAATADQVTTAATIVTELK